MLFYLNTMVMGYIVRVVFTHTLSESYVGVNGLFQDIIRVLSLTELGLGSAISYALYKPIEEKDIEKQKSLMRLYRNLYRGVAAAVLGIGLLLIPFFPFLMKEMPDVEHLYLIYLLYLLNSAASYLLIYKRTLLDAHQRYYIGTRYFIVGYFIQYILQIIILVVWQNFILYLWLNLATTLLCNILVALRANRMYPFLKDTEVAPLDPKERKSIFKNIGAMMLHRVDTVVINNTDNLVISAFIGVVQVGIYSNYYLVIASVQQLFRNFFNAMASSVGNFVVAENGSRRRDLFRRFFFIGQWISGFCTICLYELLTPFCAVSFGETYVFSDSVLLVLCVSSYLTMMRFPATMFRDAMGLFWYDRYKAIVEAVLNIVLSIIFVQFWGISGVFMGTILSLLLTSFWVEPLVLYKRGLHGPLSPYFLHYAIYTAGTFVAWGLTDFCCNFYSENTVSHLLIRMVFCVVVPNSAYMLFYGWTKELRWVIGVLQRFVKGRLHGKN